MTQTPKETLDHVLTVIKEQDGLGLSNTARLRLVYEPLKILLGAGMKHSFILKKLADNGLNMSVAGFRSSMQRIKAEQIDTPLKVNNQIVSVMRNDNKPEHENTVNDSEYSESDWRRVHVKGSMLLALAKQNNVKPSDLEGKSKVQVSEYLTGLNKRINT